MDMLACRLLFFFIFLRSDLYCFVVVKGDLVHNVETSLYFPFSFFLFGLRLNVPVNNFSVGTIFWV